MAYLNELMRCSVRSFVNFSRGYNLISPFYSGIGHILLFHRVCDKNNSLRLPRRAELEVSPEYLEGTIRFFLDHKYDIISLDQLADILAHGKINRKFVVFTFDDGYRDNFTLAYPIFKKYNMPFTIYLTTGFLDKSAIPWWYLLEDLILEKKSLIMGSNGQQTEVSCATQDEKDSLFRHLSAVIKSLNGNDCQDSIRRIFTANSFEVLNKTDEMLLDWQQIGELSRDPLVTLGAHSVNHYCLANLSEEGARYEIRESKKVLEFHIHREVKHFSYPFGDKGEAGIREFKIAKECGFKTAVTGRSANIFFDHGSYCEALPRITMGESLDCQRMVFLIHGLLHVRNNKFRRVITV